MISADLAKHFTRRFAGLAVSPDGRYLGRVSDGVFTTLPLPVGPGRGERRIADHVSEFFFTHLRDRVLVAGSDGRLDLLDLTGGPGLRIAEASENPFLVGLSEADPGTAVLLVDGPECELLTACDLVTGGRTVLAENIGATVADYVLDRKTLEPVATISHSEESTRLVEFPSGRVLLELPPGTGLAAFAEAGALSLLTALPGTEFERAYALTPGEEPVPLDPDAPYDLELAGVIPGIHGPVISGVAMYRHGSSIARRALPGGEGFRDDLDAFVHEVGTEDVAVLSASSDGTVRVFVASYPLAPDRFVLDDLRTGTRTELGSDYEAVPLPEGSKIEFLSYDVPGLPVPLTGELYSTPAARAGGSGLVLLVHGGPWSHRIPRYDPLVAVLLDRGYAVVVPNFRGSTGSGATALAAGNGEWGGAILDDLLVFASTASREIGTDRLVVFGHSFGGYAALQIQTRIAPEKVVALAPPVDLVGLLTDTPYAWAPVLSVLHSRMGTDREKLAAASPLFALDELAAPTFIAAGTEDAAVPIASVDAFAAKHAGDPLLTYLRVVGVEHDLEPPEDRFSVLARALEFLGEDAP